MNCKLITTASDIYKTDMLQKSLKKFNWDYEILVHKWEGFGGKILETYKYLKSHPEITHFFYSDSYDTIVLDTMENTLAKIKDFDCILMSAERACYPHPEKAERYPQSDSPFKYINGGGWFCNSAVFCLAVETNPLTVHTVDQVWFTDLFLNHPEYVKLDTNCEVFQTIAFCPDDNFYATKLIGQTGINPDNGKIILGEIGDRIVNTISNTMPTFIHGNGHTPMTKFYELI